MTWTNLKIGQFEFTEIENLHSEFMRPSAIQKIFGVDRSVMVNIGTYGAIVWGFHAVLAGATCKADLASAKAEFARPDPVYFIADQESTDSGWGYILKMVPTEYDGMVNYYTVDVVFVEILHQSEASRGTVYGKADESTTFTAGVVVPTPVVPLPVGAGAGALTDPTETVDFTRYIDDGAGGTYAVPCVLSPEQDWTTYGVAEADLAKGAVAFVKSGTELGLAGMIKVLPRNNEAGTKGYWELWYYNGTAWVDVARIRAGVKKSAGAYQEITASSVGPKVGPRFKMSRGLRKALRALYLPTATDSLQAWLHIELDYGRPFLKMWLESACATDFTGHEIVLDLVPTDFRYWTRLGAEVDAQAGDYGNDAYTVLMLHMDGDDASTTFTDSAVPPKTVTANGNAQIDTAQSKFGGASGLFDGTGDYLSLADSEDWYFGTGNFTIDFWVRFNALPTGYGCLFDQYVDANNYITIGLWNNAGTYTWHIWAKEGDVGRLNYNIADAGLATNNWYHIAFVRSGNNNYVFRNGTQVGSTAVDAAAMPNIASTFRIGYSQLSGTYLNGWLDEFRVSKGVARWTANFTPPTAAYGDAATAGDTDDNPSMYVATGSGHLPTSAIILGVMRKKKADCDLFAHDAGNWWDQLRIRLDNVAIKKGFSTEPVWIFCGRCDQLGLRTGPELALEALARMNACNTLVPNI